MNVNIAEDVDLLIHCRKKAIYLNSFMIVDLYLKCDVIMWEPLPEKKTKQKCIDFVLR